MASDLLHHDYGVELNNVFDTAVGDSVVMASHQFKGFKPDFVRSYQVFDASYCQSVRSCQMVRGLFVT